jgi:beta-galactosidase
MQRQRPLLTILFSATLLASACSSSSSPGTGSTGGQTGPGSGGDSAGGQTGAGNGGNAGSQTGPGSGGNSAGGGTVSKGGNSAGGGTVTVNGGNASGGGTVTVNGGNVSGGGTVTVNGGITSGGGTVKTGGGTAGQVSGGVPSGGQIGPSGGVITAGGQTVPNQGGAGGSSQPPSTGGSPPYPPSEADYSMDMGWQFNKSDVSGAQATAFADTGSGWSQVSTPHSYNDTDSYRVLISHSGGDHGLYQGPAWYRKHFKVPATFAGNKLIVEFERIRQSATFYINGTQVGTYLDGVSPCGIDITGKVTADGTTDNVLAVRVDNSGAGGSFYWNANATNPDHGGLVGHVWLHAPGKLYQTYPLYQNLKTSGIYIYGTNYASITNNTAQGDTGNLTVNVEAEVNNESGAAASATLGVKVVDAATGATLATFSGTATSVPTSGATVLKASGPVTGAKLWSDLYPNLYNVVTTLTVGGTVVNGRSTTTGFRKVEFRGGAGTGGVYVNGRFVYLLGFAQRSTNEWAAVGQAVPDWMHDFHANLIRGANSNYIRWMHVTPQLADMRSGDKYGVISIAPAGDKEVSNPTDAQWQQRLAVMQTAMIYLRNNPSVFMYEAGNSPVSTSQMQDLAALRDTWDKNGGRGVGDRDLPDAASAASSDWFGTMIAWSPPQSDGSGLFRGYSDAYRDKGPIIEEEDYRDEANRGVWDDFTPPHVGGFKPGATDTYSGNSEDFTTGQVSRLDAWLNIATIQNKTGTSRYSGYGSIYFSDSDADGRQQSSCVARVSGKVDAVRLPKEIYYSFRVAGNTKPDIHIVGHWTYPAGTKKTMYVLANTPSVELFVNGVSAGKSTKPADTYTFSFANIAWATGSIKAVGYDASGTQVCSHEIKTAGPATAIKLTPTVGPNGLQADGADVAMFDVEVVDASGNRRPDDEARIDFTTTGPGTWRGGVNECMVNSTNNTYISTECGINRVFIRAQTTPGTITLNATRTGLTAGTATVTSKAVPVVNGLLPR